MTVIDILKMVFITLIEWKFKIWNIFLSLRGSAKKNDVKVGVGRMKTKKKFVLFSNARSILELILCN